MDHSRACQRANVCQCLLCENNPSLGTDVIIREKHMFLFGAETFTASVFRVRTVAVNRDIFGPPSKPLI